MKRPITDRNLNPPARYALVFAVLAVLTLLLLAANVNTGSVNISVPELFRILLFRQGDATQVGILWKIRLPRLLSSAILGGALSLSGFLLQTFFGNPIAGPFVLGISSGAKMTVSLAMVLLLGRGKVAGSSFLICAAFLGSLLSMGFVLLISRRLHRMSMLIVCGIMIGYICSAVTDFVVTFADDADIVNLRNWSQGSFSGTKWEDVGTMAAVVGIASLLSFLLSKPIGAYQLGESYARNLGVPIQRFRVALILLSSVLSACVTAFAGPISFVGIAVPHIVKSLMDTAKPILILPACFLGGAVFCMACDLLARTLFAPVELSISSVTAVFGAPVVIAMMLGRNRGGA